MTDEKKTRTRKFPAARHRIAEFFRNNPHEELTQQDVCAKFSCSRDTVQNAMNDLLVSGEVERVIVYRGKECR